jgi:hypothetical protein
MRRASRRRQGPALRALRIAVRAAANADGARRARFRLRICAFDIEVEWFGRAVEPREYEALLGAGLAAALAGVLLDLRAICTGSFSLGLSRQTPKAFAHTSGEWWVTPLLWGLDTGMIWTTYRVSCCSWLLLLLAVLGIALASAGLVYGLAFSIPLLVMVHWPASADGSCQISRPHWIPQRPAQWAGVVPLLLLPVGLL